MENLTPLQRAVFSTTPEQRQNLINQLTPRERMRLLRNVPQLLNPTIDREIGRVIEKLGKPDEFRMSVIQGNSLVEDVIPFQALGPIVESRRTRPEGVPFIMTIKELVRVPAGQLAQLEGMDEQKLRLICIGLLGHRILPPEQTPPTSNT